MAKVTKAQLQEQAKAMGLEVDKKATIAQLQEAITKAQEAKEQEEASKKAVEQAKASRPDRQGILDALTAEGFTLQTWNHIKVPQPNLVSVRVGKHTVAEVYFGKKDIRVSTRSKYLEGTNITYTKISNYVDATIRDLTYEDKDKIMEIARIARDWEVKTKAAKAAAKGKKEETPITETAPQEPAKEAPAKEKPATANKRGNKRGTAKKPTPKK